jgi:rod shape-determining protein MreB and related proteins
MKMLSNDITFHLSFDRQEVNWYSRINERIVISAGRTDIASVEICNNLIKYIRNHNKLLIGLYSAEHVIFHTGVKFYPYGNLYAEVTGRNEITGLPDKIVLDTREVETVIGSQVDKSVKIIGQCIHDVVPQGFEDVFKNKGLLLEGIFSRVKNISHIISEEIKAPVIILK